MERAKQPQRKPTKDSRGSAPGSHLGPAPAQPLNALSSGDILQLQRTIGNKAVQRLLQAQRKDQGSTPPRIQRLPLHRVTSLLDDVLGEFSSVNLDPEIFKRIAQAISELTENWQKSGRFSMDRWSEAESIISQLVWQMQLSEIPTPTTVPGWIDLIRPLLPDELPSERKAREKEERTPAPSENSSKNETVYEPTFEDQLTLKLAEIARDLSMMVSSDLQLPKEERQQMERNQQKVQMLAAALNDVQQLSPHLSELVQDEEFLGSALSILKRSELITYNDVLNVVAQLLPEFVHSSSELPLQSEPLQQRIDTITKSSLPPEEKIAQVGQLLWGSFNWYVNSDNIESRDSQQLDQFILWLTDTSGQTPEPSGAAQMNCWEGVIFVLYKAGFITEKELRSLYAKHTKDSAGVGVAYQILAADLHVVMYEDDEYTGKHPSKGDIVSIWQSVSDREPHHVALALGPDSKGNDSVLSLWSGKTGGMLGKTTVQDLFNSHGTAQITYNTPKLNLG